MGWAWPVKAAGHPLVQAAFAQIVGLEFNRKPAMPWEGKVPGLRKIKLRRSGVAVVFMCIAVSFAAGAGIKEARPICR